MRLNLPECCSSRKLAALELWFSAFLNDSAKVPEMNSSTNSLPLSVSKLLLYSLYLDSTSRLIFNASHLVIKCLTLACLSITLISLCWKQNLRTYDESFASVEKLTSGDEEVLAGAPPPSNSPRCRRSSSAAVQSDPPDPSTNAPRPRRRKYKLSLDTVSKRSCLYN